MVDRDKLLNAQWSIIGAMLLDETVVGEIVADVKAEDFTSEPARHIFEAARGVYFDRQPVDAVTVSHRLGEGHERLLMDILDVCPTSANWRAYADILREGARVERIQQLGQQLMATISIDDAAPLMQRLSDVLVDRVDTRIVSFDDGYRQFYERFSAEKPPNYLRWGFSALNDRLFVEGGDLIVLGARPSAGKTMLAAQFGLVHARSGKRVGIFSLETSDKKLYERMMSFLADVDYSEIKRGKLSSESWEKIGEASHYCGIPLDVINASGMTVADIRAIALSRHYDVVIVDYLQIVRTNRKAGRVEEVSDISRELQSFAKTSGCTVIALSQFSRPAKADANKMPTLLDLRESGQIEQDADVIMLLWAKDADDPMSDRGLYIAKNKEGELGQLTLGFHPEHMTFVYKSARTDEPRRKPAPPYPPPQRPPENAQSSFFEYTQPFVRPQAAVDRELKEIFGDEGADTQTNPTN